MDKLKKLLILIISVGSLVGITACSDSANNINIHEKNYNEATPFVEDNASVLDKDDYAYIKNFNDDLEKAKGKPQVLVVTVKDLDEDIAEFAAEKGKQYGIGQQDKNNGLVYVLNTEGHEDFLATGYGLEDKITDAIANSITDNDESHSAYKEDKYGEGIRVILDKVRPFLTGEKTIAQYEEDKAIEEQAIIYVVLVLIALLVFVGVSVKGHKRYPSFWMFYPGYWVWYLFVNLLETMFSSDKSPDFDDSNDWFGGSSGSSSGSWSGGGGSFGGGGGGSSW